MYTCQCVSDFRFMISMIFYWILFVFWSNAPSYWSSKATLIEAVTIDGVKMATEEPFKTANEMAP